MPSLPILSRVSRVSRLSASPPALFFSRMAHGSLLRTAASCDIFMVNGDFSPHELRTPQCLHPTGDTLKPEDILCSRQLMFGWYSAMDVGTTTIMSRYWTHSTCPLYLPLQVRIPTSKGMSYPENASSGTEASRYTCTLFVPRGLFTSCTLESKCVVYPLLCMAYVVPSAWVRGSRVCCRGQQERWMLSQCS